MAFKHGTKFPVCLFILILLIGAVEVMSFHPKSVFSVSNAQLKYILNPLLKLTGMGSNEGQKSLCEMIRRNFKSCDCRIIFVKSGEHLLIIHSSSRFLRRHTSSGRDR